MRHLVGEATPELEHLREGADQVSAANIRRSALFFQVIGVSANASTRHDAVTTIGVSRHTLHDHHGHAGCNRPARGRWMDGPLAAAAARASDRDQGIRQVVRSGCGRAGRRDCHGRPAQRDRAAVPGRLDPAQHVRRGALRKRQGPCPEPPARAAVPRPRGHGHPADQHRAPAQAAGRPSRPRPGCSDACCPAARRSCRARPDTRSAPPSAPSGGQPAPSPPPGASWMTSAAGAGVSGEPDGTSGRGYRDLWRYVPAVRAAIMVAGRAGKGGPHGGSALTAECDASGS